MEKERKKEIDILKVIGLLCIILAHCYPPNIIFQLRTFDVVLMILLSAYLGLSSTKEENYFFYIRKRFLRLVIPTWFFQAIFLPIASKYNLCNLTFKIIKHTILLDNFFTIGYVWVIRIYFIVALLVPICKYLINNNKRKLLIVITLILYITYEILSHYNVFSHKKIQYAFAYIIPCLFLIVVGYYYFNASIKKLILYAIFFAFVCVGIGSYLYIKTGMFQQVQTMKYPFRLYYLSYGLTVSSLLILIFKNNTISNIVYNRLIEFISRHSLWIYLWHIFILYLLKKIDIIWYLRFFLVSLISISITLIQAYITKLLEKTKMPKVLINVLNG